MNPPLLPAKTFPIAAASPRIESSYSSSSTDCPSPSRERAWSESHVHSASTSSLVLTDSGTFTDDPSDPLAVLWKQPPKQSSSLFRRLSRTGHRKSSSSPDSLKRSLSERSVPVNREDEEDVVLVPQHLQRGIEMLRVTRKKVTKRICAIDPVNACVSWDSKDSSKRASSISRKANQ
jgi:hypothetical protein